MVTIKYIPLIEHILWINFTETDDLSEEIVGNLKAIIKKKPTNISLINYVLF